MVRLGIPEVVDRRLPGFDGGRHCLPTGSGRRFVPRLGGVPLPGLRWGPPEGGPETQCRNGGLRAAGFPPEDCPGRITIEGADRGVGGGGGGANGTAQPVSALFVPLQCASGCGGEEERPQASTVPPGTTAQSTQVAPASRRPSVQEGHDDHPGRPDSSSG